MISLLHKYGKTIAIVATQSLNDAIWGLMGDFALRLFHVAILLSLWRTVMAGQGVVAGMSLEAVLTYTMVAAIFADQLSGRTRIDDDLWSGNIANRFLRPMGIYGQMLAEMVGGWIPGLLFFALPLLLIAPLLGVDPFRRRGRLDCGFCSVWCSVWQWARRWICSLPRVWYSWSTACTRCNESAPP